jgi:hypothetical protein
MFDNFERDPTTGQAMLATAENVAAEAGIEKAEIDALAVRRYEQYTDALADDRAFQRDWMVPVTVGPRREPVELDEDWGVRPILADKLAGLQPLKEGGVVSYGTRRTRLTARRDAWSRPGGRGDRASKATARAATGFARSAGQDAKAPVPRPGRCGRRPRHLRRPRHQTHNRSPSATPISPASSASTPAAWSVRSGPSAATAGMTGLRGIVELIYAPRPGRQERPLHGLRCRRHGAAVVVSGRPARATAALGTGAAPLAGCSRPSGWACSPRLAGDEEMPVGA